MRRPTLVLLALAVASVPVHAQQVRCETTAGDFTIDLYRCDPGGNEKDVCCAGHVVVPHL